MQPRHRFWFRFCIENCCARSEAAEGLFRGVLTWWHSREVKPSTASLACLHPDSVRALLAPTGTARYYTNQAEQFLEVLVGILEGTILDPSVLSFATNQHRFLGKNWRSSSSISFGGCQAEGVLSAAACTIK